MTRNCPLQGASLLRLSRSVHWLLIVVRSAGLQPLAKLVSLSKEGRLSQPDVQGIIAQHAQSVCSRMCSSWASMQQSW